MKRLIYLLLALPLFVACSNEEFDAMERGEEVQVTVTTEVPVVNTRAVIADTQINEVVCGVFENDVEIAGLRTVVPVPDDGVLKFTPTLINGHTYTIVLWAHTSGSFDTDDLTAITREPGKDEALYDAFTTAHTFTVNGSGNIGVTLQRPFAQLNIGVSEEDWKAVANLETFNLEPKKVKLTVNNAATSYNALTGKGVEKDQILNYSIAVPANQTITSGSDTCRLLSQCYVLLESGFPNADVTYEILATEDKYVTDGKFSSVPFDANHRTNILGRLMTGKIDYSITLNLVGFDTANDNNVTNP